MHPEDHSRKVELEMFDQTYTARKLPSACIAVTPSPLAAMQWYGLLLLAAYGQRRTPHNVLSMEMSQQFFVFFVPGDLDIRTWARFVYNAPKRQVSSSYV